MNKRMSIGEFEWTFKHHPHVWVFERMRDIPEEAWAALEGRKQDLIYRCSCGCGLTDGRKLNPGEVPVAGEVRA